MIADKFNVLQMGMIACERVFKVLDNEDVLAESEIQNKPLEKNHILNGNIEFTKVWFAYNDKDYVLKGINFEIEAGKTIAIVGNTGSGKTTIVSLVNRLYQIQKGSIMIGGVDVKDIKIEELRSKIAVVLQDVFLFSGTVLDNMTLRNPNISRDLAIDAAKSIGLHDFIMQLPENYDFNVMERGSTLSTGQRQLLSFARALLYNPSILILDEATSSIDAESELLIQNAIDKVIKGRTSIIIAHRLSTIKKADKIIVLESGQIKEMGSHSELINKKGHYFELYQKQFSSDLV
jgi:ATP-binding cassette subfamily B protein